MREVRADGLKCVGIVLALCTYSRAAAATPDQAAQIRIVDSSPIGPALLETLGTRATDVLAPSTRLVGALVGLPRDARAQDLGLEPVAPGIGRLRGTPARITAFAAAHPDLRIEMAPPLHPMMDRVSASVLAAKAREVRLVEGRGVMVGVADSGIDVTHPEMRDATGGSRVAWLLDLSLEPAGLHPELEDKFGIKDDTGKVIAGRVLDSHDIDALLARIQDGTCNESTGAKCAPTDEMGHGTHVTGIAAASGANGKYPGVAPKADIVFVRVIRNVDDGIENDDLLRAVQFMFDRADAVKKPLVANLSLGTDFGPHDGTLLWEQAIAAQVGPAHPGHVVVAAAGNSALVGRGAIHQSVRVNRGAVARVPIVSGGAESGSVQVWVTFRRGANINVGLEGPDGEWIAPVDAGHQRGKKTNEYNAGVIHGSQPDGSPIPAASHSAVVVWRGKWPAGTYNITLEGSGMAELYLESRRTSGRPTSFANGVREGTIGLPATHPDIISVGCTVNRPRWVSIAGQEISLTIPLLDREGGRPIREAVTPQDTTATSREAIEGEICGFSSTGPTATGVPKPEISAPGALVVSAMSRAARPGGDGSMFTSSECPATRSGAMDDRCFQLDDTHAIATGTSMSSPVVAGVVALLLEADPTLTQDKVVALLQAGAHQFRAATPFADRAGPGEVDALGSLDALEQMKNPALHLPSRAQSWLTLSADYVTADGSTPMTAIVELRTADGAHRGDFFDRERLAAVVLVDGKPVAPAPQLVRRGPGVWFFTWDPPAGLGGLRATFGATFDGEPIVASRSVPIAPDRWTAMYPSYARGSSCTAAPGADADGGAALFVATSLALAMRRRRALSNTKTATMALR